MVNVRGQIEDAPVLDISAVRREYWSRKEILLPSLTKFSPPEEMTRFQKFLSFFRLYKPKRPSPKVVLRRMTEIEWRSIDERFTDLKLELAKEKQSLTRVFNKNMKGKKMTKNEWAIIHKSHAKAMPIYIAMLECMIEEPNLDYDGAATLLDTVDDFDKDTLLSYVNMLTTEKANVAKKIYDERMQELDNIQSRMVKP